MRQVSIRLTYEHPDVGVEKEVERVTILSDRGSDRENIQNLVSTAVNLLLYEGPGS